MACRGRGRRDRAGHERLRAGQEPRLVPRRRQAVEADRDAARRDVWVSHGLKQKPYAQTTATLEPIGVPGGAEADAQNIYVTTLDMPKPGKYWILAEPIGGARRSRRSATRSCCATRPRRRSASGRSRPRTPCSSPGVDPKTVTTAEPPDRELLRTTVAAAMAAHRPFVVTFATPLYCQTRTCGPVVQVDAVGREGLAGQRRRLHPHRDLQGQRPGQGHEPVGRRVEAPERAVHLRRRQERRHPVAVRGRLQRRPSSRRPSRKVAP